METERTRKLLSELDSFNSNEKEIREVMKKNRDEGIRLRRDLLDKHDLRRIMLTRRYKHEMKDLTDRFLRTKNRNEADRLVQEMMEKRRVYLNSVDSR